MPATIELRTRDVKFPYTMPFMGHPQHGYYVSTEENGLQYIIRAGNVQGYLSATYAQYHQGMTGDAASDWITDKSQYRSTVLYSGDNITARGYMNKIWDYGQKMNQQMPDYKYPVCDIINLGMYNKCSQSNCNAFIQKSADYAGLTIKIPLDSKGYPVWMPGLKSDIRDTLFDNLFDKCAKLTAQKAEEVFDKFVAARAYIVNKYQTQFKTLQSQHLLDKHADELMNISNEFIAWQKNKISSVNKDNEAVRLEMQSNANIECTAKGQLVAESTPCGPHNGVMIKEDITVTYPSPMFIHTHIDRYWKCEIKVPCDDIKGKYQVLLDQATMKNNLQYQQDKADMQIQVNKQVDSLPQDPNALNTKSTMITSMIGELESVKISLSGQYGLDYQS